MHPDSGEFSAVRSSLPLSGRRCGSGILVRMRLTDFWDRMQQQFGPHAESLAELHVFTELGGRTPAQALADGEPTVRVWRAVCEGMEVPPAQR